MVFQVLEALAVRLELLVAHVAARMARSLHHQVEESALLELEALDSTVVYRLYPSMAKARAQ